jgi:hypothetical protein
LSFVPVKARAHPAATTVPKSITPSTQHVAVMGIEKDTAMPIFTVPVDREAPVKSSNVTPTVVTDAGTPTNVLTAASPAAAPATAAPPKLAHGESG